jgi:hypothetical protein
MEKNKTEVISNHDLIRHELELKINKYQEL